LSRHTNERTNAARTGHACLARKLRRQDRREPLQTMLWQGPFRASAVLIWYARSHGTRLRLETLHCFKGKRMKKKHARTRTAGMRAIENARKTRSASSRPILWAGGDGALQEDALQHKAAARNPREFFLPFFIRRCGSVLREKGKNTRDGRSAKRGKGGLRPGAFRSVLSVVGICPLRLHLHSGVCAKVGCYKALVRRL